MLEHFFGSKTRVKLLQLFFREPEKAFFLRELTRRIDTQLNAVRREVNNLLALGIIESVDAVSVPSEIGSNERHKYYRVKPDAVLYREIEALLMKAQLIEEKELIESLTERAGTVQLLALTGLFTGASDVTTDILLVGKLKPVVIARLIKDYEEATGKAVRYTLFTEREFRERREIGDKFLYSVFEAKHLLPVNEFHLT